MTSTTTTSRRFKLFGYSKNIEPYTKKRIIEFGMCNLHANLNREYDPDRDDELRAMRAGSNISDFDNTEFRIQRQKVDLTYVYENVDIEMPTAAQLRRMPGPVRRNMRVVPQTPRAELYNRGPAVAPTPKIPDPYDDSPLWGFRDKYMYRARIDPEEAKEAKRQKMPKENKKKRKARGRNQSEHPEEADIEIGHGRKRPRVDEEEQAQMEEEQVQDYNPVHLPPTPATTPGFTAPCDMPVQSIEQTDGQVEANIELLANFNNTHSAPTAPTEARATTSTSSSSSTSPPTRSRAAPSSSSSSSSRPSPTVAVKGGGREARGKVLRGGGAAPAPSSPLNPPSLGSLEPVVEASSSSSSSSAPAATVDQGPPQFARQGFLALPNEELVYRNQSLGLQPAILGTCTTIFREAARTLYGENEFLYLLRDGANHVADVTAVGQDDAPNPASDAEEDPEWGPARRATRRGRRSAVKPLEKFDINLDRYIRYVRHICIEAEHNRFDEAAQTRAASAVKVFTDRYPAMPAGSFSTRLASLELRVVPMWEANVGELGGGGGFTFLDC
ncbi:hypothetical protein LMH87_004351 [Akanthomyces muscarius]|uniref:Uncharacterized protein n=1 Tax=Akanthomyces muscarius TaxID=2231603 RepID=A0A9W8Q3X5_AKAMU|nr:hypothetical protein LMH87_004351 [Akanthomyces muscarius]KAJ4145503.1 hypothetical protein LMH87_004351 [Akanthomyces muscarius]